MESVPPDVPDYNLGIHANKIPTGEHLERYNAPSTREVAVVVAGQQLDKWEIKLRKCAENFHSISEIHRS